MKKVILNKCYGYFSVSGVGYAKYCEKIGKPCFMYKMSFDQDLDKVTYTKKNIYEDRVGIFDIFLTKYIGDVTTRPNSLIHDKDIQDAIIDLDSDHREDPILIEVVEELGEDANDWCSQLKVVEIPDDLDYVIDNNDGIETLHQRVQTW